MDDRLSLKATARQDNVVYLNGNPCCKNHIMHITHNDSISFLGLLSYYNYKISHILVDDFSNASCRIIQANVSVPLSDKTGPISSLQTMPSSGLHTDTEKQTSSSGEEKMNTTGSSQSDGPIDEVAPVERVANSGSFKTSTSSNSAKPASSSSCIRSNLLRQFECSICYDTLACAVCLSPCGDNFCYVCIADWYSKNSQCPICQSPFRLSRVVPNRLTESIIREVLSLNDSSSSSSEDDLRQWEARVQLGVQRRKLSKGVEKGVVVDRPSIATAAAASAPIVVAPIDLASVMPTARSIRPPSAAMEALLQQQTYQHAFQSGHKHRQLFLPTYFNASGSRSSVIHVEDDGRASKRRSTAGVSAAVTGPSSSSAAPAPHAVFDLTEDSQKQL